MPVQMKGEEILIEKKSLKIYYDILTEFFLL